MLQVATAARTLVLDGGERRTVEVGARLVAGRWSVADASTLVRAPSGESGVAPAFVVGIAELPSGDALVGTAGPGVGVVDAEGGGWRQLDGFATVDRSDWYSPQGDAPDVFAVAGTGDAWFAAVHVGGLWRSADEGASWTQVVPTDADVHHVVAGADGVVVVAAAAGIAVSTDGGRTFGPWRTDGIDHTYCTAVVRAGDRLVVGSSPGPFGDTALYAGRLDGGPFARTGAELPAVRPVQARNLLAADGERVAFAAGSTVWSSTGDGGAWSVLADVGEPVAALGAA